MRAPRPADIIHAALLLLVISLTYSHDGATAPEQGSVPLWPWPCHGSGPCNNHESGDGSGAGPGPGNSHEYGAGSVADLGPCNRQDIRPDPCGTAEPEYRYAPVQEPGCTLLRAAAGRTDHVRIAWSGSSLTLPCPLLYPSHSGCYNRHVTISLLLRPCRHALCRLGRTARAAAP